MNLHSFETYLNDRNRAPNTVRGYMQSLARFITWYKITNNVPSVAAADVGTADINAYRLHLRDKLQLMPNAINSNLSALREWGKWAVAQRMITTNPARHADNIPEQAHGPKWLTEPNERAILRAAEKCIQTAGRNPRHQFTARRNYALVLVALRTGLRVAELCALRRADVAVKDRVAHVTIRLGKGGKKRVVPLGGEGLQIWNEWEKWRTDRGDINPLAFPNDDGKPLTGSGVARMCKRLAALANVPFTPHHLRHTFAHNLVDRGIDITRVQALMGHTNANTTARYVKPSVEELASVVEVLG